MRVVCRFHTEDGILTYFRSDEEFAFGMVDQFDVDGQRSILFEGDHHDALEQFITMGEELIVDAQLDRLDAHIAASGFVA